MGKQIQSGHVHNHILLVQLRVVAIVFPTTALYIAKQTTAIVLVPGLVQSRNVLGV